MLSFGHKGFKDLLKIPENQKCFDCDKSPCQWASINNGIFLCMDCGGIHRGLGVEKSYVRSITLDNWTDNQFDFMRNGGNKQLKSLLSIYNFDRKKLSPEKFYQTKLMEFYRRYLKSKVEKKEFNEKAPSNEEAFQEKKSYSSNYYSSINGGYSYDKFSAVGSNDGGEDSKNREEEGNSFSDTIMQWMNKTVEETKNLGESLSKLEIGNKIASAGKSVVDVGNKIVESPQVQTFAKKANDTLNYYLSLIMGNSNNQTQSQDQNQGKKNENNRNNNGNGSNNNEKEDVKEINRTDEGK